MPSDPVILGFDTSAAHCAAALLCGDTCVASRHEQMDKGQAEHLLPLLEEMITEAGMSWTDLSALGVGIGPGNFTGLRISVAAARGLALGLDIPAVGVSLLDAVALGAPRPTLACVDARRDHVYLQRFSASDAGDIQHVALADLNRMRGEGGLTVVGPRAAEVASLIGAAQSPVAHDPASAIARISATRWTAPTARPAPLYLRPADALPSGTPAPVILHDA